MIDAFTHLDLSSTDPIADMEACMAGAGIQYALAVETWKGDNLPLLHRIMESGRPQFRIVWCFRPVQRESYPDMLQNRTVVGLRVRTADIPCLREAGAALQLCRKWLVLHAESGIGPAAKTLLQVVERTPGLQIYVPHLGWPVQGKAEDPEWEGAMAALRQIPRLVVGISAIPHFSGRPFPHTDVEPYALRLREMFGPGRLVAASDYPLMEKGRYTDYMRLAEQWIGRAIPGVVPDFERDIAGKAAATQPRERGIEIA